MPILRYAAAGILAAGLSLLLPCSLASADDKPAARPLSPSELEFKRRVEAAERANRTIVAAPGPTSPRKDGVVQIPIDTSKRVEPLKDTGAVPGAEPASTRGAALGPPPPSSPPPPCPYYPEMKTISLLKAFTWVTWHVCATDMGRKGLWVGPVQMKRTPTSPWMTVLFQAGLAEIFVPYHQTNARFYDLEWTSQLDQVTAADAGPNGTPVTLTNETVPTVVTEVRDRGVAWLCKEGTTMLVNRGQEFLVWAVSDAGNYDNIIQFGFRDDGAMTFRMGNTGFNAPFPPWNPLEAHSHNALWRVDMDLNGAAHNTAYWMTHSEPNPNVAPFLQAKDFMTPFNVEATRRWDPLQYTSLLITDAAQNRFGNNIGYEFMPVQAGISRHYGDNDIWTHNDVYVTQFHLNEFGWATSNGWAAPDDYLLTYLNGESVSDRDLVVWIKSSGHHEPTDEDRSRYDSAPGDVTGITLVHWSGFDVMPHDLFNANPLSGSPSCGG